MQAKSVQANSFQKVQSGLQKSMAEGFKPTLAIVFISIRQDRKAVYELLRQKHIDVLGATSCGEFVDGHQSEGEISMLLMDVSREAYHILLEDIGDRTVQQAATLLARTALEKCKDPSLIICSTGTNTRGEFLDGSTLVHTVKEILGPGSIFFGGMAGDDMTFSGSFVFAQDRETDYGIAAIVFDAGKITLSGMAITGWKPMGICRTVTKSVSNKVLIKVADNGGGIPQHAPDKIFQPFFTTKPTGQGTGLGLSLAYDIVTKGHGGELKVDTEERKGTTFTVRLIV